MKYIVPLSRAEQRQEAHLNGYNLIPIAGLTSYLDRITSKNKYKTVSNIGRFIGLGAYNLILAGLIGLGALVYAKSISFEPLPSYAETPTNQSIERKIEPISLPE